MAVAFSAITTNVTIKNTILTSLYAMRLCSLTCICNIEQIIIEQCFICKMAMLYVSWNEIVRPAKGSSTS